ncbi:methyl-accepting chemotaxis protein [Rhizobium aquaticum]|uniref:Methyl-accepting chemotaxis protein n=2 Tax=Rhizobium aquaticum TaxID=1549636 RepID=A0ABV2IXZ8_9HYPH
MIEFDLDGKILTANENFCSALGYELSEIVGKHHRMFVDPKESASPDYAAFWANLKRGQFDRRQYKRIAKGGREVWIEASYNPVLSGKTPVKVVKIATDITDIKRKSAEDAGKLQAISRVQAVIEFTPTGEVLTANDNFLNLLGYTLAEIAGKHHSLFCDPDYVRSEAYRRFWADLADGKPHADEFKRVGKGGREAWIQASYNPIFDMNGKVFKVVKFATDVTDRVKAVHALGQALKQLAQGDLEQTLDTPFPANLESVRHDFNASLSRLRDAMSNVAQNAVSIAAGSSEIRDAADDLARRTEQQAASIEETAAALEEITTAVADASRRAEEAGRLVATTKKDAEQSGLVVKEAITAMGDIEKSSGQISNIIGVIDEIAFQTNLLALNAGVEAARAGEAGKGFAVVAQEVRELAQRSAKAAKEIKTLIGTSSNQVKQGVVLVDRTGHALEEIVQRVKDIDRNVAAIVESSREQATGLKEINQAVNIMDQGTQKNAAMVEETTAASHSLASEVDALNALLATFKTGDQASLRNFRGTYRAAAA